MNMKKKIDLKARFQEMDWVTVLTLVIELILSIVFIIGAIWFTVDKIRGVSFLGKDNGSMEVVVIVYFYLLFLILGFVFVYELLFKDYKKEKDSAIPRDFHHGHVVYLRKEDQEKADEAAMEKEKRKEERRRKAQGK